MVFAKKCFCQKREVKFYCDKKFNENVVDILYCPDCVDRASADALIIRISGIKEMIGLWGIKFNPTVLAEIDSKFKDNGDYYENLFQSGRCVFEKVWKRKKPTYEIVGIKSDTKKLRQEESLSGPDYLMIRKDGKPTKLPKKTWTRGEESPPRQSGYKGHR